VNATLPAAVVLCVYVGTAMSNCYTTVTATSAAHTARFTVVRSAIARINCFCQRNPYCRITGTSGKKKAVGCLNQPKSSYTFGSYYIADNYCHQHCCYGSTSLQLLFALQSTVAEGSQPHQTCSSVNCKHCNRCCYYYCCCWSYQ
jgi:hypothetical protein